MLLYIIANALLVIDIEIYVLVLFWFCKCKPSEFPAGISPYFWQNNCVMLIRKCYNFPKTAFV